MYLAYFFLKDIYIYIYIYIYINYFIIFPRTDAKATVKSKPLPFKVVQN